MEQLSSMPVNSLGRSDGISRKNNDREIDRKISKTVRAAGCIVDLSIVGKLSTDFLLTYCMERRIPIPTVWLW
jgi:hypothetical protein